MRPVRTVAPAAAKPRTSTTARTVLSLVNNIAFITPSVRAATWTEIVPVAAAFPAASRLAALIVEDATEAGTAADAACWDSTAANAPHDKAIAPLSEPLRQHDPRPRQPARYRPFGAAELPSRFLPGLAFQIAQDDGDAVLVGKAAQLLIEDGQQITP